MYKICILLRLQGTKTVSSEFRLKKGKNLFRSKEELKIQGLEKVKNQGGFRDLYGENS